MEGTWHQNRGVKRRTHGICASEAWNGQQNVACAAQPSGTWYVRCVATSEQNMRQS